MRAQIQGPGNLAFGDTLIVRGVRRIREPSSEWMEYAEVSFDAFGNHVEIVVRIGNTSGRITAQPHNGHSTSRHFGTEQIEYMNAMAILTAGMFYGWFPEKL